MRSFTVYNLKKYIKSSFFKIISHQPIYFILIKHHFADVVLGVAQLCNKKTGPYFTVFDEDIASAFAVYCCISISHVSVLNVLEVLNV